MGRKVVGRGRNAMTMHILMWEVPRRVEERCLARFNRICFPSYLSLCPSDHAGPPFPLSVMSQLYGTTDTTAVVTWISPGEGRGVH